MSARAFRRELSGTTENRRGCAVIVIADEAASIFGEGRGPRYSSEGTTNTTLAAIASEAVQLGRSEAVDFIVASQRGTVTGRASWPPGARRS